MMSGGIAERVLNSLHSAYLAGMSIVSDEKRAAYTS
jgi:hypothetical protein